MPYRNTSLCRYTGVHVTTCIPMGFTGSSLLLTGTLVGLTKQPLATFVPTGHIKVTIAPWLNE